MFQLLSFIPPLPVTSPTISQVIEAIAPASDKPWIESGNVVSGIIGGLVAVVVTLISEFLIRKYERNQEKKEQQIVRFKNQSRRITNTIFQYLGPDASVEMMKNDLGPPNKQYKTEAGFFSDETLGIVPENNPDVTEDSEVADDYQPRFTAYLYFFENADVKIISEDGESITAITVMAHDASINLPHSDTKRFNEYKIGAEFFVGASLLAEHMPGCRDTVTALCEITYSPGTQTATTYFCYDVDRSFFDADLQNNPKELIGATISGACISKGAENASYLYLSEIV